MTALREAAALNARAAQMALEGNALGAAGAAIAAQFKLLEHLEKAAASQRGPVGGADASAILQGLSDDHTGRR